MKRNKWPFNKRNYPKPKLRLRAFLFLVTKNIIFVDKENFKTVALILELERKKRPFVYFLTENKPFWKRKTIIVHVFFCCGLVTICYKTQRLLMCFNKLARPTSTSEVFSQSHDSHVVLHKECELCQTVSSKSMLGPGQFYTFYKNVSFVGPKTRLQLKSAIGYVKLRFHSTYFSPIVLSCLHFSHTLVKYCGEYFLAQEPRLGEVFSGRCDSIYVK